MSFESVVLDVEKDIKIGVADALKIFGDVEKKAPAAITGLTALAGAVDVALTNVETTVANPTTLLLTFPTDVANFKAVWTDAKALLASIGVK